MLEKDLPWVNPTMMYRKAGEIKCQAALILPGTSIAIILVNYLAAEIKIWLQIFKEYFFRLSREYIDAQKGISRSHYASDDEESAKIMSSSVPLSVLLIPSIKEVNDTDFILIVLWLAFVLNWFMISNRTAWTVLMAIGKDARFHN